MIRTFTAIAVALAACEHSSGSRDAGLDARASACAVGDPEPYACAYAPDGARCAGDAFPAPTCVDGAWQCPTSHIPLPTCDASSCLGLPLPGESCGASGWQCTGGPEALPKGPDGRAQCALTLCLTCAGFAEPFTIDGCTCACAGSDVRCEPTP